ncbi:MAG TPA: PP2C family protein-serine/threonine phosphatase [Candidatus Angelobacter sp.]|nr:PP2C family protein-serine/threonine phosphatase [Candidatus Angelobacter sp.]
MSLRSKPPEVLAQADLLVLLMHGRSARDRPSHPITPNPRGWGPRPRGGLLIRYNKVKRECAGLRGRNLLLYDSSMSTAVPVETLRADAVPLLLGVIVTAAGVGACLVWLPRAKRQDLSLLYFGIAAMLYGIRLMATTATAGYLIPQPAIFWKRVDWVITSLIILPFTLFFVETVAPQWKKASYWIVSAVLILQAFILMARWTQIRPALADLTNSVIVLVLIPLLLFMLFFPRRKAGRELWIVRLGFVVFAVFALYTNAVDARLIPGNAKIEFIGFIFFLCCLGYVAANQTFRNEERLRSISRELEIARGIQSGLLPEGDVNISQLEIAARFVPASSVAGDFYDFLIRDGRELGVLVADVSGHGIPAALSASMVKVAIRSQADQADSPADVLTGLNSILYGNMQAQFVTAGYIFMNVEKRELSYAGAGHPPLLVWRAAERRVESIEENGLFLGAFPGCRYTAVKSSFLPGDRCLLYTDGIIEAPNSANEEFGSVRLEEFLAANAALSAKGFCDAMVQRLSSWCGSSRAHEPHDDLTMVVIDFKAH